MTDHGPMIPRTGSRPRVVESHRLVRFSFIFAGLFAAVAVVWAVIKLAGNATTWWGPLHAFLVGTVLCAISGTSQMFTTTWSASTPAPRWMSYTQGIALVIGAGLVLVGVGTGWPAPTWIGGTLVASSLVMLGVIVVRAIKQSLLRRFDLSARFYLLAFATGLVGVSLGILMGTGTVTGETYANLRVAHLHLNLIGLVGFTILGTIPTLLPTFAHQKTVSGVEAVIAWWLCVIAAALMGFGVIDTALVGVGVLVAAAAGTLLVSGILFRLERRDSWETLPLFHVSLGLLWLLTWTFVDGYRVLTENTVPTFAGWTMAAVTAGVGQILLGSIAYLLPVVLGAPIGANLKRMGHLPLIPLVAANVTGLGLVLGIPVLAAAAGAVWLIDFTRRVVTLRKPVRT